MSGATQICSSNVSSISVDALFLPLFPPPVPLSPATVRAYVYVYAYMSTRRIMLIHI